ncbi:MAG: hypothetical protein JW734_09870 [Candidatus Omnitrophica bacterium]|nr:hypothetical protein [Candidatus Omnitrophota bacterium]
MQNTGNMEITKALLILDLYLSGIGYRASGVVFIFPIPHIPCLPAGRRYATPEYRVSSIELGLESSRDEEETYFYYFGYRLKRSCGPDYTP